jgi:hypothetical protein
MDSSGLPKTTLHSPGCDNGGTPASVSKADLDKWASWIACSLVQLQTPPAKPLGAGATPEGWRGNVEALTPDAAQPMNSVVLQATNVGASAVSGNANDSQLNRVQVRFDAGSLGELALIVERLTDGVRVLIGAENSDLLAAMSGERGAMEQALAGVGHTVASLSFVRMDGIGTDLAQSRLAPSNRARGNLATDSDDPEGQERQRKARRLDVRG